MKEEEEANKKKEIKIPPLNIKAAKRSSPSYYVFHYVRKYEKTDKNLRCLYWYMQYLCIF